MRVRRLGIAILVTTCLSAAGMPALARPPYKKALADYVAGEADDYPAAAELAEGRAAIAISRKAASGYSWNPFERVARPDLPTPRSPDCAENPIDLFIA